MRIAEVFLREHGNHTSKDTTTEIRFQISCEDQTFYESDKAELFDEGGIVDIKRTNTIHMSFSQFKPRLVLDFSLVRGDEKSSMFKAEGENRDWVNGRFEEIKQLIIRRI